MREDGKRDEGQKGCRDDLRGCPHGGMEEEEVTSHHPGPQPPPEQPPPPPGSWGRGWGAPHPWQAPRGRRIQNNTAEVWERHGSALGAAPLAGAVLRAECSRDIQGHQGSAQGHTCCICCLQKDSTPSSWEEPLHSQLCYEFQTRGISATCRCCTAVPKTWSDC